MERVMSAQSLLAPFWTVDGLVLVARALQARKEETRRASGRKSFFAPVGSVVLKIEGVNEYEPNPCWRRTPAWWGVRA